MSNVEVQTEDRESVAACLLSRICQTGGGDRRGRKCEDPPIWKCSGCDRNKLSSVIVTVPETAWFRIESEAVCLWLSKYYGLSAEEQCGYEAD